MTIDEVTGNESEAKLSST